MAKVVKMVLVLLVETIGTLVSGSKGEVGVDGEGIGGPVLQSRSRKEPKLLKL